MKVRKNIAMSFRFTKEDFEIFNLLKKKLNINSYTAIIRYLIKKELDLKNQEKP